jgi:hypothetical protein
VHAQIIQQIVPSLRERKVKESLHFREKGRVKNLPKGKMRSGRGGGGGRHCLNVQMEPWLGGLLVGGVRVGRHVLICLPKGRVATSR